MNFIPLNNEGTEKALFINEGFWHFASIYHKDGSVTELGRFPSEEDAWVAAIGFNPSKD